MAGISGMTAPQAQTMTAADRTYAADMAGHARDMALFNSSESRKCAAQVGGVTATAGVLGCLVVSPILCAKVSNPVVWGVTLGASALSNLAAIISLSIADIPCAPVHPVLQQESYG